MAKYNVAEDAIEDPWWSCAKPAVTSSSPLASATVRPQKSLPLSILISSSARPPAPTQTKDTANYHTYMGTIYQGRYVAGIVAGMKMKELIDAGTITEDKAKVGYVAAYPYAEVISGYTAFFLGVRSVVPAATMEVNYTNSWGDYDTEKTMATAMIEDGCVIISQHSDTEGLQKHVKTPPRRHYCVPRGLQSEHGRHRSRQQSDLQPSGLCSL